MIVENTFGLQEKFLILAKNTYFGRRLAKFC
jgi:hypothetical protein